MTSASDQLLTHALTTVPRPGAPRIIGIDGPSGAGKTTFADALAIELLKRTGKRPQVVHMDDVYAGWTGLAEAVNIITDSVLEPLSHGVDGAFRRWDWASSSRADMIVVPIADWVILEGVGSGSRPCRPHLAALAWIEAEREVRMRRGIERDGEAFRPHWERWSLQEDKLFAVEDTRSEAAIRIRT